MPADANQNDCYEYMYAALMPFIYFLTTKQELLKKQNR
jgi:hypothetical protein